MIWRRTIVLFFAALAASAVPGVKAYEESRPRCVTDTSSGESRPVAVVEDGAEVGFTPCFIDSEVSVWFKTLVLSWFLLTVALSSSIVQDCFLYLRGRRLGVIVGPFRWMR